MENTWKLQFYMYIYIYIYRDYMGDYRDTTPVFRIVCFQSVASPMHECSRLINAAPVKFSPQSSRRRFEEHGVDSSSAS